MTGRLTSTLTGSKHSGNDLDFTAAFSQAGNTIIGTGKGDLIDAANAPKGQPVATSFDDLIIGNKGKDRAYGGDGFDTLEGGKDNDKLYGGNDGDKLLGGTGHDGLYGGAAEDGLFFDFKLSKKGGAAKNFDKIDDFTVTEDTRLPQPEILQGGGAGRPSGHRHPHHAGGREPALRRREVREVPHGVAPASVDDIHFVVYA